MPGRARKKNDAEQRNGLYEKDGELVEWRNGNQIGPRTNFMVKPIGCYEQGTIGGQGCVMEVSVKDNGRNNKWKAIAKATDFQTATSTIKALNKDRRLLAPNPPSLNRLLPEYMDRIIRKFLSEEVKTPVQLEVKSSKQEKRKRPKEEETSQDGRPTKKRKEKKSKKN